MRSSQHAEASILSCVASGGARRLEMRRLVVIALAFCVVLTACGRGSSADSSQTQVTAEAKSDARAAGVLAITTPADGSTTMLQRLDADTLARLTAGTDLGEYHGAWAFSRDRRVLAVGTFARTGVRVIDPASLAITRDIPLPLAAVALGWVSADRIAVLLQRGGVVVVDADRGRVERRWPLSYRVPCGAARQAVTPHGVIFVITGRSGTVRLLRIDADGQLRVVTLARVRAPSRSRSCGAPALAADPAGARAVVLASDGPLAEIDLASLSVAYQPQRELRRAIGQPASCPRARICAGQVAAAWLDDKTVVTGLTTWTEARDARPVASGGGVAVIDSRTWSARVVDRRAGDFALAPDNLLTFGAQRRGMRAIKGEGTTRWVAVPQRRLRSATANARRVYALEEAADRAHVLDAATGAALAAPRLALGRLQILTGRSHAGDPHP